MIVVTKFQLKFFTKFAQKRNFQSKTEKIKLVHASMVVTYYIKLFRAGAERRNGLFISLLLLVAETKITPQKMSEIKYKSLEKNLLT